MSLNRDAMYAAFEKSPGDLAGYGAMADELTDLGYESIAHAFRWMSRRRVWPHKRTHYSSGVRPGRKVPERFRWAWYESWMYVAHRNISMVPGVLPAARRVDHSLPPLVMTGTQKVFPSHQAAVMWLAGQLAQLKATWDVDDPKQVMIGEPGPQLFDLRQPPIMAHGDEVDE